MAQNVFLIPDFVMVLPTVMMGLMRETAVSKQIE